MITRLPPFDNALQTKRLCQIGLAFSYLISVTLVACGIAYYVLSSNAQETEFPYGKGRDSWYCDGGGCASDDPPSTNFMCYEWHPTYPLGYLANGRKEVILLIFNTCLTVVTECLGYIHATSLRWALYHEQRLFQNSNLRLFTSARKSRPNSWYVNAIWGLLLTVGYSCSSQAMLSPPTGDATGFNSMAILILGCSLLILCFLATWSMFGANGKQIITWSSDPLNTTLALLHTTWSRPQLESPTAPRRRQPSIQSIQTRYRWLLAYLWGLVPVIFIIAGSLIYFNHGRMDWTFLNATNSGIHVFLTRTRLLTASHTSFQWSIMPALDILLLAGLQILYTLALHTVEQLVNLRRDEAVWRRASRLDEKYGLVVGQDSFTAAFTSWQTLVLLILKPLSHWLFGLSIVVSVLRSIHFRPLPLLILGFLAICLAAFATFLAFQAPKGTQPATYGNLRMLAGMVDDWGEDAGAKLYWGDKGKLIGDERGVRLAGTSACLSGVSRIRVDGVAYLGLGVLQDEVKSPSSQSL